MNGTDKNVTITNNLSELEVNGSDNKVIIKSHINELSVIGTDNKIDGTDPNCLIDNISVNGNDNEVILNLNCQNASQINNGENKIIYTDGSYQNNMGNNFDQNFSNQSSQNNFEQNYNYQNNNAQYNIYNNNQDFSYNAYNLYNYYSQININNVQNNHNNNYNAQNNNNNVRNNNDVNNNAHEVQNNNNAQNNNNVENDNNVQNNNNNNIKKDIFASSRPGEEDYSNLTDHEKKIRKLYLEMDEYQYKHIQKYESRKETECAICLEEFKGTDIIKAFHKCEHIFHKNCLRDWLKKQKVCPLCKHNLEEDIQ